MSIFEHFQHLRLSSDQETALQKLEGFVHGSVQVFMLKGYAGSGKTTILKGLVEYLNSIEKEYALMAPTGRAAKVIRERTGQDATTIHKSIDSYEEMIEVADGESFYYNFKIRNNADVAGRIFIVDESSMVSDAKSEGEFYRFGTGHLLTDLMNYTRVTEEGADTKIIFVGDPCQLPPVGDNSSKAFDPEYLMDKFDITIESTEMKEVKRHDEESGILKAATRFRKSISSHFYNDFNLRPNGIDIFNPIYEGFLDTWESVASPKIIIASKNKTCLDLNLQIRERKYGDANLPVQKGDIIIVGGNNYRKGVFNGEFAVVNEISSVNTKRTIALKGKNPIDLSWRDIELVFPDAETSNKIVKGKILENFLYGDNYLKPEETQALYVDFTMRNKGLKPKTEEFKEAIINDDFFNCLLIKYGYAVTCHKAQGGEWENVFTVWDQDNRSDFDCLKDRQLKRSRDNEGFYRWAYTAITRASKNLYALNPPLFNSYSSMSFLETEVLNSLHELAGVKNESEDVDIDDELQQQLSQFCLLDQAIQIQDHFIQVRHAVRKQYIEIIDWTRKNSEVFYSFKREEETTALKTWVNKDNVFNGKYLKLPSKTNSVDLYNTIESILNNLPHVSIKRETLDAVIYKIEFEFELEEKFPFTRNLFDDLCLLFEETDINVDALEHQQYKERYTFKRNQEEAVIDFEYKGNGFFGRVVPIQNKTNSIQLVSDIQKALQTFNIEENASQ